MVIKIKYWIDNSRKNQITKAISIINGLQNYYFLLLELSDNDVVNETCVDWDVFSKLYSIKNDEYVIFITEKPFVDNWFSHEEYQFSVITMHDWEKLFAPPSLKAYLVYQIAQAVISFEGDLSEKMEMRMVHDYAEGCIFDLCMDKTDIHLGMIAGNICPKCRGNLLRYGISEKAIYSVERMLSYVRSEAIGKPIVFDEDAAFIVMRFSQNDENDHAFLYGIRPALEKLKIKCIRADNQITSGQLLEKIKKNIEKSRFVIIKVDSNNLNVYFELGLAMGLNKDVLLISQEDLVLHLPTDLRNWECLTYSEGNYDQLKNKVIKFFADQYHYNEYINH
jgi:hypothetical protein